MCIAAKELIVLNVVDDRSWHRLKIGTFLWRIEYKDRHCLCCTKALHHKLLETRLFRKLPLHLPVCCCKWDTGLDPACLFSHLYKIFFEQDKRLLGGKTRLGNKVTECFQFSGKNRTERSITFPETSMKNSVQCFFTKCNHASCSSSNLGVMPRAPHYSLESSLCHMKRTCSLCVLSQIR